MEVMLIQMSASISGVLRGDGLKWKLFQQMNIMQTLCQILEAENRYFPGNVRPKTSIWHASPCQNGRRVPQFASATEFRIGRKRRIREKSQAKQGLETRRGRQRVRVSERGGMGWSHPYSLLFLSHDYSC